MKCHACGQDNADSALFCTACRRPLVAPTKLPTRLEPLAQPAMAAAAPAMAAPYGDAPSSRNRFAPPNAGAAGQAGDDVGYLTDEEARAAVIGDSNTLYYLTRFERLAHGEAGGWHWPGFLITWYWMLYRKMWVPALFYFFAPYLVAMVLTGVAAASPVVGGLLWLAWVVTWLIGPGLWANKWYYNHCQNKIRNVRARGGSKDQMIARLEAAGGTSNILVIILAFFGIFAAIGILAAVALPAYQQYTVKAKVAEALQVGNGVAAVVGQQYEQTGQLPANIDSFASQAVHQSRYVKGIVMDGTTGTLTLRVIPSDRIEGSIQLTPAADNKHHLTWTCSTEDLAKYVPKSCKTASAR